MTRSICLLIMMMVFSGAASAAEEGENPNIVRWAEGTIVYRTIEAQRVRAVEKYRLNVHPDGSRTVIGHTDNFDAENSINMIHRVDRNFRPLESIMAYWQGGTFNGTGLFTVRGNTLESVIDGPLGRVTHSVTVPDGLSLVPHPLATDSWHFWYYDKAKGGEQKAVIYNPQVSPRTGVPVLGHLEPGAMSYEGTVDVTVPAGTFTVDRFNIDNAVDIYLTGPDRVLVRFLWTPADADYVLVEFPTAAADPLLRPASQAA